MSASSTVYVSVVVSPEIDVRYFHDTITADEESRIKLVCAVIKGDPPLSFQWRKDGQIFDSTADTTVQIFEDSSIITFKRISSVDRGYYTCVATNIAASNNMTTQIIVNVSPRWVVEPSNATAILGSTLWLDCSAVGFPTPSILWKKLIYTDSAAGDFTYVHSSPRAHRYNNGTLVLSEVEENDAGAYLCQASNGIGAGLSKIIELKVLIPPTFQDPYISYTVPEDTEANLKCVAYGDQPISITWQKNKEPIDQYKERYSIHSWTERHETTSELRIIKPVRLDSGMYTCLAQSHIGTDEAVMQLIIQGRPSTPVNITVMNITSRSLNIQWDIAHDGNSLITSSIIQYNSNSSTQWDGQISQLIVSGAEKFATLRNLSPTTNYFIKLIVENSVGKSDPSEVVNATTEEEAPSAAPLDILVHSTGAQSIKVQWKPPPEDTHNGIIKGYYIGYRQTSSGEPYHYKKVDTGADTSQQSTYITGLKAFTKYDIVVKAFNSAGIGPKSIKVIGKTLETAPPTSPVAQVKSATVSTIEITWERDTKDKSAITDYILYYKTDEGSWIQQKLNPAQDQFTLSGLKCGTRYHLYMTASNTLGTGEPSVHVSTRTRGAAPMSPPASTFLVPNSTSVTLKFNKWQNGGCVIQHFVVQYRQKHQPRDASITEKLATPIETYILRHLIPDREYIVIVSAHNDAGMTQGEYRFRTLPFFVQSSETSSRPAFGKQETDTPFHKNIALIIPIVISSLLIIMTAFSITLCLKKHAEDRKRRLDCEVRKQSTDSMMMSDINKQVHLKTPPMNTHYIIPSAAKSEYSEPYNGLEEHSPDGVFATIKRQHGRQVPTPVPRKPEIISSHQISDSHSRSSEIEVGKWGNQSSISQSAVR